MGTAPLASSGNLSLIKDAKIEAQPPQDLKLKVRIRGSYFVIHSFDLYLKNIYQLECEDTHLRPLKRVHNICYRIEESAKTLSSHVGVVIFGTPGLGRSLPFIPHIVSNNIVYPQLSHLGFNVY